MAGMPYWLPYFSKVEMNLAQALKGLDGDCKADVSA